MKNDLYFLLGSLKRKKMFGLICVLLILFNAIPALHVLGVFGNRLFIPQAIILNISFISGIVCSILNSYHNYNKSEIILSLFYGLTGICGFYFLYCTGFFFWIDNDLTLGKIQSLLFLIGAANYYIFYAIIICALINWNTIITKLEKDRKNKE